MKNQGLGIKMASIPKDCSVETTLFPGFLNVEGRGDGGIGIYIEASQHPVNTLMLTKHEALQMTKWLVQYLIQE